MNPDHPTSALSAPVTFGLTMVCLVEDETVVHDALAWLLRSANRGAEGLHDGR